MDYRLVDSGQESRYVNKIDHLDEFDTANTESIESDAGNNGSVANNYVVKWAKWG